jgi:excisionase family DNA binding protein|tara:strand:- start:317 stop:601 length:285 start_codon:yes stop_codon:yes gene_type:complete
MPMDWNQDPYLQRLEEELKKMNERLSMIERKIAQPQKLLTVKEVAQFLRVKERTVRYYLNDSKEIPYLKVGKKNLIPEKDLSGFIESRLRNKKF